MQTLRSWQESLSLLVPEHLKLLLLVSLKGAVGSYYLFLRYWWWLLGLLVLGDLYFAPQLAPQLVSGTIEPHYVAIWWFYAYFILRCLVWFLLILTTRSSIKNKNIPYFLSYIQRFFLITIVGEFCIVSLLGIPIAWVIYAAGGDPAYVYDMGLRYCMAYLVLLWSFFLLDTDNALRVGRSFYNMLLFVWYNLPFFIISLIIFNLLQLGSLYLLYYLIHTLPLGVQLVIKDGCWFVLLVLVINIVATFYIKRVHDGCDIYCPK